MGDSKEAASATAATAAGEEEARGEIHLTFPVTLVSPVKAPDLLSQLKSRLQLEIEGEKYHGLVVAHLDMLASTGNPELLSRVKFLQADIDMFILIKRFYFPSPDLDSSFYREWHARRMALELQALDNLMTNLRLLCARYVPGYKMS